MLLLLRTLISHSTPELVLARLEELGLSMDYVHSDVSTDSTAAEIPTAPSQASQQSSDSSSSFRDPLNVTQPGTLPQVAMARYGCSSMSVFIIVLYIVIYYRHAYSYLL